MTRLVFALCLSIGFTSCQKEDELSPYSINTQVLTETLTTANTLIINKFIEEGVNKTALYSAYSFSFSSNGTVLATSTSARISGTYVVFRDDNKTELRMSFPNNRDLFELTDDWYFVSDMNNTLSFEDSGDVLQFFK